MPFLPPKLIQNVFWIKHQEAKKKKNKEAYREMDSKQEQLMYSVIAKQSVYIHQSLTTQNEQHRRSNNDPQFKTDGNDHSPFNTLPCQANPSNPMKALAIRESNSQKKRSFHKNIRKSKSFIPWARVRSYSTHANWNSFPELQGLQQYKTESRIVTIPPKRTPFPPKLSENEPL